MDDTYYYYAQYFAKLTNLLNTNFVFVIHILLDFT